MRTMNFKLKQKIKKYMHRELLPTLYSLRKGNKKAEGTVVFADAHHDCCPEDMRPLIRELKRRGIKVKTYFFDSKSLNPLELIKAYAEAMAVIKEAAAVVCCDYFLPVAAIPRLAKRPFVINLWHGCGALKKFGHDCSEDIPEDYELNPFANIDAFTVSAEACVPFFESATGKNIRKEGRSLNSSIKVIPIGVSVTDNYYDKEYLRRCRNSFERYYPEAKGKKVLLWAPTFRQNAAMAKIIGEEHIDRLCEDDELKEYYIIKSPHPHAKSDEYNMSTRELLVSCDMLITDFSSVLYEALLLDKPLVLFAPDYKKYIKNRGLYADYSELPGIKVTDICDYDINTGWKKIIKELRVKLDAADMDKKSGLYEELKSAIVSSFEEDTYKEQRKLYREKYMHACDGNATKKIADYIMERL